jgi:hypothetical protein
VTFADITVGGRRYRIKADEMNPCFAPLETIVLDVSETFKGRTYWARVAYLIPEVESGGGPYFDYGFTRKGLELGIPAMSYLLQLMKAMTGKELRVHDNIYAKLDKEHEAKLNAKGSA